MNKLYEYQKEQHEKLAKLRQLAIDERTPRDKVTKLRKEQDEAYKKYNFIKILRGAMKK